MFEVIRISAFKDNYIWLLRKGRSAIVVDPGDALPVLEVLAREALVLRAILVTHHHADHQGGVATLSSNYPVEVFGPAAESITGLTQPLAGGETIRLESIDAGFQVLAVPGHTLGHLAYYGQGCLFCGDTLFGAGCGRLFEGTPAQMSDSLARLTALSDETAVYCAHEYTETNLRFALTVEQGNANLRRRADAVSVARAQGEATVPSTIGLEKATNPFLRCGSPEIVSTVRARREDASNPLAVFTALRKWRNTF
ncbi:MAG: hydroxyacylglutathione hydrolase [Propionivibrio sp.]